MTNSHATTVGRRVWVCLPGNFDKPTVLSSVIAVEELIYSLGGEAELVSKSGDDSYIVCEHIGFEAWKVEIK